MSFKSKWRRLAFASVILASASVAQAGIDKPVKTAQGLVKGTAALQPGVTVFKGIPFAEAPVGKLRFMSAVPVKTSWKGVRDGSKWGDTCVQPPAPTRAMGVNQATDMPDPPKISEDCLNLAVWTGAKGAGEKRPVMVWFYGGAYSEGGNSMPFADGSKLAAKGAIIVSVNYRLGMFGFMSHPDATTLSGHNASGNQCSVGRHCRAQVGEGKHRRVRRRPEQCHHLRPVGRRLHHGRADRFAAGQGPVRKVDFGERGLVGPEPTP